MSINGRTDDRDKRPKAGLFSNKKSIPRKKNKNEEIYNYRKGDEGGHILQVEFHALKNEEWQNKPKQDFDIQIIYSNHMKF